MSNKSHSSLIGCLFKIADESEPLAERKNPALATTIGFFTGGIGLGLYLRSWRDFLIPFGLLFIILLFGIFTAEVLSLITPVVWAAYGYRRVISSNAKLRADEPGIIEAEFITVPPKLPTRNQAQISQGN